MTWYKKQNSTKKAKQNNNLLWPYSLLHCASQKGQINTITPTHQDKQRYFRDANSSSLTICASVHLVQLCSKVPRNDLSSTDTSEITVAPPLLVQNNPHS